MNKSYKRALRFWLHNNTSIDPHLMMVWLDWHSCWQSRHLKSQHGNLKVMSSGWGPLEKIRMYLEYPRNTSYCVWVYIPIISHYIPLHFREISWNILLRSNTNIIPYHSSIPPLDPVSHCAMRISSLYHQVILPETTNELIESKFLMKFQWFS